MENTNEMKKVIAKVDGVETTVELEPKVVCDLAYDFCFSKKMIMLTEEMLMERYFFEMTDIFAEILLERFEGLEEDETDDFIESFRTYLEEKGIDDIKSLLKFYQENYNQMISFAEREVDEILSRRKKVYRVEVSLTKTAVIYVAAPDEDSAVDYIDGEIGDYDLEDFLDNGDYYEREIIDSYETDWDIEDANFEID